MKPGLSVQIAFLIIISSLTAYNASAQGSGARLNHIAQYVLDLKVSTDFYREVVGLDTIPEPFHDGRHTWFLIGPKSHLHIISGVKTPLPKEKNTHLCFTVASVEAFIHRLTAHNIPFESWTGEKQTFTKRVDGVKQIYFQDPDGYWIEVNDARE
ncbi:MAG TPA: VOC family protein [Chitinophagaceae bacterium]|nr:VOC family protein [Chitinophagaceae bacterium]